MNYRYLKKIKRKIIDEIIIEVRRDCTKIDVNKVSLELARYYEEDGHTVTDRDNTFKSDILALLSSYTKESDTRITSCIGIIIMNLVSHACSMGMYLSRKDVEWYIDKGLDIPIFLHCLTQNRSHEG